MATQDSIYWHKAGNSVGDHKIPMKALVMAAGYGTRLEPLTLAVPKPMAPIANLPTMRHNLELLKKHGFTDITANIHYHPEQIENYFEEGSDFGVVVHDENGKVIAFQEKPKPAVALSDLVNIGIYVIEPEILKLI